MTDPPSRFDRALALAAAAHAGQRDKAGLPYILHPVAVATAVAEYGELAMCVGVLHDVVEDTDVTVERIADELGEDIAARVALLTKPADGSVDYDDHLAAIATDPIALRVKWADMAHNVGRLDRLDDPEARERLRAKYAGRLADLEARVAELDAAEPTD